jgi:bacteriocin biosynthesis cyclodehydratase domain-containing protein
MTTLPPRPRLHRSYYLIPVPDSENLLLYREGRGVQLKPVAGSTLLARLLSLLDGSRTVPELVEALDDVEPRLVISSLERLGKTGLLEDGGAEPSPADPVASDREAQRTLLSHIVPDGVAEALAALEQARVGVVGSGAVAAAVSRNLEGCGVGEVRSPPADAVARSVAHITPVSATGAPAAQGASAQAPASTNGSVGLAQVIKDMSLMVAALDHLDPDLLELLNAECLDHSVPLLPVVLVGWEGHLGPTCIPGQTACVRCASLRAKSNLSRYQEYLLYEDTMRRRPGERPFGRLPHFPEVLAGLAATEVVKMITHCYPTATHGRVLVIDLLTSDTESHDVLRVPRCPACSRVARRAQGKPLYARTDSRPTFADGTGQG